MFVDFILNRQGFGEVGSALSDCRFDAGLMRPYIDRKGRHCVTVNTGKVDGKGNPIFRKELVSRFQANTGIVVNGPTSLRDLEWRQLDNTVIRAARDRLRAWTDLAGASSFSGFNGMSKMMLEHETMSDPGEAFVDMDTMTEGRNDAPKFQLEGIPLPITHSDFWFSSRRLAVSRNSNTPLDVTMGEAAGRRIAEKVEDTLIGVNTGITFGPADQATRYGRTPSVYGYLNFPARITKSDMTLPTAGGWTPSVLINEVIEMMQLAYDAKFYGPFMMYYSTDWDAYMGQDYTNGANGFSGMTLRQRLLQLEGLRDARRLDRLTASSNPFTILLIQMTSEVARAVIGMDITTVQWESMGGMRLNFKVMTIMVPQLRANFDGDTGIIHGVAA